MSFRKNRDTHAWAWGVLAGAVFLVIGTTQGQFAVSLQKAGMICLECIGIG